MTKAKNEAWSKWIFLFPFRLIPFLAKEFTCIKVTNGRVIYTFSTTKFFRSTFLLLCIDIIFLVIKVHYDYVYKKERIKQKDINTDVLASFIALAGVITIIVTVLQFLYQKHKKHAVDKCIQEGPDLEKIPREVVGHTPAKKSRKSKK